MAIKKIDSITINDSQKFCNGYIYNINYKPSFADSPSTLTVNIVNEDGIYNIPEKSIKTPYNIKIGNKINLNMYCISSDYKKSPSSRTLEVSFIDGSFILDKIWVGLHKRDGLNPRLSNTTLGINNTTSTTQGGASLEGGSILSNTAFRNQNTSAMYGNKNLMIVGRELHPCDFNKDGVINQLDVIQTLDPCNPCPDQDIFGPCAWGLYFDILDVAYNFNELLTAIREQNITIVNPPTTNDKYITRYDGSLRDVLKHWGSDYGFSFFWEDDKLHFIDIKQAIQINAPTPSNAIDVSEKESLEGTISRSAISYWEKQGEQKKYTCKDNREMVLQCITLGYIYNLTSKTRVYPIPDSNATLRAIEALEIACGLTYYDPTGALRDAFYWYHYYGITTATKAKNYIDKPIRAFGDLNIRTVISQTEDAATFTSLKNLILQNIASEAERVKFNNNISRYKPYFILATRNEGQIEKEVQMEYNLAKDFIGKYWGARFATERGIFGVNNNFIAGSESVSLIPAGTSLKNVPFTQFGWETGTIIDSWVNPHQSSNYQNPGFVPSGKQISTASIGDPKLNSSVACMTRTAKWYPNIDDIAVQEQVSSLRELLFYELRRDKVMSSNQTLFDKFDEFEATVLIIAHETTVDVTTGLGNNPLEDTSNLIYKNYYEFGLKSTRCQWVTIGNFTFYFPTQSTILAQSTSSDSVPTDGKSHNAVQGVGYKVQLEQTWEAPVYVPKHQSIMQTMADTEANTLVHQVNFRKIEDSDFNSLGEKTCGYNSTAIQDAHNAFCQQLTFQNIIPTTKKSITIPSVEYPEAGEISISNGLIGLNIGISENGIVSTYEFSNRPATPISLDVQRREVEKRVIQSMTGRH